MLSFKEKNDLSINFKNLKLIDTNKSKLHSISIYRHILLGKILVINNEIQHVEKWSPFYHEMVVHLPIAFMPTVKKVLILGGGSLFAAFEALKYRSVKKVKLVDYDENVIKIMKKNYEHARAVLRDKRFELIINDAFDEIKNDSNKYDLIINDSVDLIKHGRHLNINLLEILSTKLNVDGICSDVVYRNIFERTTTLKTVNMMKEKFNYKFSLITVPEYPGIFHILSLWSKTNTFLMERYLINKAQKEWVTNNKYPCQFYNPTFLNFYCYLPNYLNMILHGYNI